jgi:tungstate transport system substrate-binding protein
MKAKRNLKARTQKTQLVFVVFILFFLQISHLFAEKETVITMATTTSTENSGLLDFIHPVFTKETGIKIKVIALGTGAAIQCAMDGNADLILVHDPKKEAQFVRDGFGIKRYSVMHNDFIIIGPAADPAKIKGEKDAAIAFKKIARSNAIFVSRGDHSGTHAMEQSIWQLTGLELKESRQILSGKSSGNTFKQPAGSWYLAIGQGMGNTIQLAYEKKGYTLTDRGTYLAYRKKVDMEILCQGDNRLHNPYGIIAVNPAKHPLVNHSAAEKYIRWILSPTAQKLIGNFAIDGETLFFPDALPSTNSTIHTEEK